MESLFKSVLPSSLANCIVCNIPCTFSCSACNKVGYCGRKHQQKHWKEHKSSCFPVAMATNPVLGRYLVTTRDVKQGELILKESPLICAPHYGVDTPDFVNGLKICLSCFRQVQTNYTCKSCGWPVCGVECEINKQHAELECEILADQNIQIATLFKKLENFNFYQGITILRAALQKKIDPSKWAKIRSLQSNHVSLRETEIGETLISGCVTFLRDICGLADFLEEDDVSFILGVIAINAFICDDGVPVDGPAIYRSGSYLYHIASICAHNCIPNTTWSIKANSEMQLIASIPIKKGESITLLYCDGTLPSSERRELLKENKDFDCSCGRCRSSSAMDSYFTGVKCGESSCEGYLVHITDDDIWTCEICKGQKSQEMITSTSINTQIEEDALSLNIGEDFSYSAAEKLHKLISKYSGIIVHVNHYKIYNLETELMQRIAFLLSSTAIKYSERGLGKEIDWAGVLVDLGRKLMPVTDIICPGFNRHRGRILYYLQKGLVFQLVFQLLEECLKNKRCRVPESLVQWKDRLDEIMKIRSEVGKIFMAEMPGFEEYFICKEMETNSPELVRLHNFLRKQFKLNLLTC